MRLVSILRMTLLSITAIALVACSDTNIASPGPGRNPTPAPSTPPVPDGDGSPDADFTPIGGCPSGTSAQKFNSNDRACLVATGANGEITSDLTLIGGVAVSGGDPVYFFDRPTFIGTDDGPTPGALGGVTVDVTIEPGVILAFKNPTDFLTVNRGSRLMAIGTASAPIVLTSDDDLVDGIVGNEELARGQWGGLIINGRAPINNCANPSEPATCETSGEGGTGSYGGDNPADSSGALNYVRVQYAGFEITPDNELNGIAFQGVGNGTNIDFIQVHNNDDDGIEFFGGTVNVRHVVLTGVDDDALDWVAGWNGLAQDIVIVGSGVGDNAFEGDNNSSNNDVLPRSNPTISNWTAIGGATEDLGMQIREGTAGKFLNGIVTGWDDGCLDIDDASTLAQVTGGGIDIDGTFFSCVTTFDDLGNDGEVDITTAFGSGITTGASTLSGVLPGTNEAAVAAIDPSSVDVGLASEPFAGAFAPGLSASQTWAYGWTVPNSVFPIAGCPEGTIDVTGSAIVPVPAGGSICRLSGTITSNLSLTQGNVYQLNGSVFIGQDQGPDATMPLSGAQAAELTIPAGVSIFSVNPTDFLVINRGSKIIAAGTVSEPIIFTSDDDLNGSNIGDERGQWGGLIINGNAPVNNCANPARPASCETAGEGGTGSYGGNDPNDDSGLLNFVRVQHAGFEITPDNELNGIAFQGVGDGTTVDFVQVHANDDDGIEFFGGTVDVKHIVITGVDDDALDWVAGWDGSAQFVLIAGSGVGDNAFEGDNNSSNNDVLPRSDPTIANWTAIGGATEDLGMQIREGTAGNFVNGVVTGWDDGCLDIDDAATLAQVTSGDLNIDATFFGCAEPFDDLGNDGSVNIATAFPGIVTGTTSGTGPEFTLSEPVSAVSALALTALDPALDGSVTAIGLDGQGDDWYLGWTLPGSF